MADIKMSEKRFILSTTEAITIKRPDGTVYSTTILPKKEVDKKKKSV